LRTPCKPALALAGIRPVKGREYYDISAMALVLDVVDNYTVPDSQPPPCLGLHLGGMTGRPGYAETR
jgi:hypothetical protein